MEGSIIVSESGIPAFYDPPDPLPTGVPGELIRVEVIAAPARMRAWRVLYHSTTRARGDIAISGLVVAPDREPPPEGFPLIASAHGTTGVNRRCAPSIDPAVAFLVAAMYSWNLLYPDAPLEAVLTEEGIRAVETLKQNCGPEMYPPIMNRPPHAYVNPLGIVLHQSWRTLISQNVPGHTRVDAPIFVGQGDADQVVPPVLTELFVKRLQLKGNDVRLHRYRDADHNGLLAACQSDVIGWLGECAQAAIPHRSLNA